MSVIKEEILFKSTDNKNEIHANIWMPHIDISSVKGIIQISHGMCEYINRYEEFAEFMCNNGYIVCGHDHLGHGQTVKSKADLGFFAENNGYIYLIEDLYKFTTIIKNRFNSLPIILLGHSMGSFILRNYLIKYSDKIDGAIISGTSGKNPLNSIAIKLANMEIKRSGPKKRSTLLDKLSFGNYNKKYTNVKTKYDWLSKDTNIVDKYANDDLCTFIFTASAFKDLFTLLKNATSKDWTDHIKKSLPIYIISGDMDPVGNYGKGVIEVKTTLENANIDDITLNLYKDGRHEMLNEVNRLEVYNDILNWLNKRYN